MLISPTTLRAVWNVQPRGVLHIGAHDGEEDSEYRRAGWGDVIWVEAMPDKARALEEKFRSDRTRRVVTALAWDSSNEQMVFNIANNGMSSSVFQFGTHANHHPAIAFEGAISMQSVRLDEVLEQPIAWELINLDVQGAELHALRGLGTLIQHAHWIYTEVNEEEVYAGCPLLSDIDQWLGLRGFLRVDTAMTRFGWGDALYARPEVIPLWCRSRRTLRRTVGFVSKYASSFRKGA